MKKDPGDFLTGPDFGKRAVFTLVQIYRERLAIGGQQIFLLTHSAVK